MKITIKQLLDSVNALEALSATQLPIRPAYWVGKLVKKLNKELENYNEARVKLWKSVGAKENDETRQFEFTPEQQEEFTKQHEELLAIEIDLSPIEPIKLEALMDAQISPATLIALDWLIIE